MIKNDSPEVRNTRIEELRPTYSVRLYNVLRYNGLHTIGDIQDRIDIRGDGLYERNEEGRLTALRNSGRRTAKELHALLEPLGIDLRGYVNHPVSAPSTEEKAASSSGPAFSYDPKDPNNLILPVQITNFRDAVEAERMKTKPCIPRLR